MNRNIDTINKLTKKSTNIWKLKNTTLTFLGYEEEITKETKKYLELNNKE